MRTRLLHEDEFKATMTPKMHNITESGTEYSLPSGKPRLGDAFAMLKARWQAGRRDLETGLRLMFLAWYACAELQRPPSRNCSTPLG
jgi:hypothetical protein